MATAAVPPNAAVARPGTPVLPDRNVAKPVANLGNTCYMNAVLQALAHAPELCQAMDCEPHHVTCPIAIENRRLRRTSPSSSPDNTMNGGSGNGIGGATNESIRARKPATRKLRRSSRKSSPTNGTSAAAANDAAVMAAKSEEDNGKYCALCEIEWHMQDVHAALSKDKPVAPTEFVNGFIDHVAPWFKLGLQEDSHEFLRLLIDAMQKSCKEARSTEDDDSKQVVSGSPVAAADNTDDAEYPFQLFRGTVESNVTCDSCKATSSTLDPIEDVGLEVTPSPPSNLSAGDPPAAAALSDVTSAFQRFARVENLDAGYKCEKCGKGGRATKQSRMASIPPILTLHLKRFRYGGDSRGPFPPANANRRAKSGSAKIEGHIKFDQFFDLKPYLTEELQAKHKNMFCRLFAVIVHAGKNSHSGHYVAYVRNITKNEWWKMDDARVTLASHAEVMQAEAYMLFYRVVDHPIAVQLRNRHVQLKEELAENARLAAAAAQEEKEILVVELKSDGSVPAGTSSSVPETATATSETVAVPMDVVLEKENEKPEEEEATANRPDEPVPAPLPELVSSVVQSQTDAKSLSQPVAKPKEAAKQTSVTATSTGVSNNNTNTNVNKPVATRSSTANSRKRPTPPEFTDGETWARTKTCLPQANFVSLRKAQEFVNENVQFKAAFFKLINDEASKANAKVGQCPIKTICGDDVLGGSEKYRNGLRELIYRLAKRYEEEKQESFFMKGGPMTTRSNTMKSNLLDKFVAVVEPSDDNLML